MESAAQSDDFPSFRDLLLRCCEEITTAHDHELSKVRCAAQLFKGLSPRSAPQHFSGGGVRHRPHCEQPQPLAAIGFDTPAGWQQNESSPNQQVPASLGAALDEGRVNSKQGAALQQANLAAGEDGAVEQSTSVKPVMSASVKHVSSSVKQVKIISGNSDNNKPKNHGSHTSHGAVLAATLGFKVGGSFSETSHGFGYEGTKSESSAYSKSKSLHSNNTHRSNKSAGMGPTLTTLTENEVPSLDDALDGASEAGGTPTANQLSRPGALAASVTALLHTSLQNARRASYVSWQGINVGVSSELPRLDNIMAIIISIDIVLVGVSYDYHPDWGGWVAIHGMFAVTFLLELLTKAKLLGCRKLFQGPDSGWNLLDVILMIVSTADVCALLWTSNSPDHSLTLYCLRVLRLCRIWKIARAPWLPFASECRRMLSGAAGASKTLFWTLVLMAVPHYVIAVMLRAAVGPKAHEGQGAEAFANVGISFFNVFRCSVVGECTQLDGRPFPWLLVDNYGSFFAIFYVAAVSVMEFGLFHVITATYVAQVVENARQKDNQALQQRLTDMDRLTALIQRLLLIIWELNEELNVASERRRVLGQHVHQAAAIQEAAKMEISCHFFEELLKVESFHDVLTDLDVCLEDRMDLFDALDVDSSGSLDITELLVGITKLRGNPRRSDIVSNILLSRQVQKELREFNCVTERAFAHQDAVMQSLLSTEHLKTWNKSA